MRPHTRVWLAELKNGIVQDACILVDADNPPRLSAIGVVGGALQIIAGGPPGNAPSRGITVRVGLVTRSNMVMRDGIISLQ